MPEDNIKTEVILKTQKYLGKYVKKPALSDKLLKKPPFRFLHDVINAVIKETGFLKGLFSDEELNSENVKDKEAKLAFLAKLIEAVKTITKNDLAVRPSKIIAGLEPTETNLLLQAIGKAIEKKLDSKEYIKQLQSGEIAIKNEKNKTSKPKTIKKTKNPEKLTPKSNNTPKNNKIKSKEPKNKEKSSKKKDENKEETLEVPVVIEEPKQILNETNVDNKIIKNTIEENGEENQIKEDNIENKKEHNSEDTLETTSDFKQEEPPKRIPSVSRPKSARPKSDEQKEPILTRQQSALRPPSVRPSSARPGAPRLRPDSAFPLKEVIPMGKINVIVENFDKDVDDEETVIIQREPEIIEEPTLINIPNDNKGHLVEQILEQIQESDTIAEEELQKEVLTYQGKDSTLKETNSLRSMIQSLTKTANPLGKLLNYLHEDIDAMHTELEMWSSTKKQLFDEITKQKKISMEMNKPLISHLEDLTKDIKKIENEIATTRSNILRNDLKISGLLMK